MISFNAWIFISLNTSVFINKKIIIMHFETPVLQILLNIYIPSYIHIHTHMIIYTPTYPDVQHQWWNDISICIYKYSYVCMYVDPSSLHICLCSILKCIYFCCFTRVVVVVDGTVCNQKRDVGHEAGIMQK